MFVVPLRGQTINVMLSDGSGWEESGLGGEPWEHVSVSLGHRCPTWEELEWVRRELWSEDDTVIQIHPPLSRYVNAHPHVFAPVAADQDGDSSPAAEDAGMTLALAILGALTLAGVAASLIAWGVMRLIAQRRIRRERPIACGSSQLDESAWTAMSKGERRSVVEELVPPTVEQRIRKGQDVTIVW